MNAGIVQWRGWAQRDGARTQHRRMAIAVAALIGLLVAVYLSTYLVGLLGQSVCAEGSDCETVLQSPRARLLGIPTPFIGLFAYSIILVVALRGIQPAHVDSTGVARVLSALGPVALAFAVYNTTIELFVIRAVCLWCLICCAAAVVIFALTLPEFALRRANNRK